MVQQYPANSTEGLSQDFHFQRIIFQEKRGAIMLVLKRRKGQEIVINGQIRILVVQTGEGSCSLAFEAPDSCRIRRGELPIFDRSFQDSACHSSAAELQVH